MQEVWVMRKDERGRGLLLRGGRHWGPEGLKERAGCRAFEGKVWTGREVWPQGGLAWAV